MAGEEEAAVGRDPDCGKYLSLGPGWSIPLSVYRSPSGEEYATCSLP